MAEPSLGEISNMRVDPELGSGQPAVVFDNTALVNNLTNAANQKAQYDWQKYNLFQKNMADVYKNLGDISQYETAQEDKPALRTELASIYKDIAKNPEIFAGRNAAAMADVQQRLAGVTQKSVQSKQDKIYDFAHRQYLAQNPELNTDENKAKIDSYLKSPLGQRQQYNLDIAPVVDIDALAMEINKSIAEKHDETKLIGGRDEKGNLLKGDTFILPSSRTVYNPNKFMDKWMGAYDYSLDKRGNTLRQFVDRAYAKADKNVFPTSRSFWEAMGRNKIGKEEINEGEFKANPQAFKFAELGLDKQRVAQGWESLNLRKKELEDKTEGEQASAFGIISEMAGIVNASDKPENRVKVVDENGKSKFVFELSDPTLLQSFGNIDKDGKTTNVPDATRYNKDADEIELVYFQKDDEGNLKRNKEGGHFVDRTVKLNPRTWAADKIKRSYNGQASGKVYKLVQDVITKNGGNFYNISKALDQSKPQQQPAVQQSAPPAKMQIRKSDIANKATAAGYSAKEYETMLKQKGIKIID